MNIQGKILASINPQFEEPLEQRNVFCSTSETSRMNEGMF